MRRLVCWVEEEQSGMVWGGFVFGVFGKRQNFPWNLCLCLFHFYFFLLAEGEMGEKEGVKVGVGKSKKRRMWGLEFLLGPTFE